MISSCFPLFSSLACLPFINKKISQTPSQTPEVIKEQADEDPINIVTIREPFRIPDSLLKLSNPSIKAQFKAFCKKNNLCVACSYVNPEKPTVLVFNGTLYECPHCDSDVDSP
jgi:hypothetical protein